MTTEKAISLPEDVKKKSPGKNVKRAFCFHHKIIIIFFDDYFMMIA